ncbi:MAG: 4-alpha-glucanotransferase [Agriterribacter sp.]
MVKIHFYIRFSTKFGQSLLLSGNIPALGNKQAGAAVLMQYLNDNSWYYTLELNDTDNLPAQINYTYLLKDINGAIAEEWDDNKTINLKEISTPEISTTDTWNFAGQAENAYYTAPFQQVLLPQSKNTAKLQPYSGYTHLFKVKAPLLKKDEAVCILGSTGELGNWDIEKAILLQKESEWWTIKINLSEADFYIAYKYGIYNTKKKIFVCYEDGDNRLMYNNNGKTKFSILHDGFIHFNTNKWRGAGVAIPVFSLRSNNSLGTGEFTDIKLLVDWAKKNGMHLIQLLPVNDTTDTNTWKDSYPYNAISAFALHPLYLNIEIITPEENAELLKKIKEKARQLNKKADVDYEAVLSFKWKAIKEIYKAQKKDFFQQKAYKKFFDANKQWLLPYAVYSYLRDKNSKGKDKTIPYRGWEEYSVFNASAIEALANPAHKHFDGIGIYYFVQYHLHTQLKAATDYAHKNGIIVKGDIPIGVSRNSCDAWMEPGLFHMDMQAGAPPDDFAVRGQNWGFPTYNWERMKENNFEWWRRRFAQMSEYFDAFRIDHILGFFRIWSVPTHAVEGLMGHFVPATPVHINEFAKNGISFEYSRFCQPYITDAALEELFGDKKNLLKAFLDEHTDGTYALKKEYTTQKQVEEYFAAAGGITEDNIMLQAALFSLIANVILFEAEDSGRQNFHFRIDIESTSSFRHLNPQTQAALRNLYIDYFYRRQDDFWAKEALEKLPALKKSTNMLICGEDLGMVPGCVPETMRILGLLSLEIQRMPKQLGREFFDPAAAPYLSVITPSTHDMSTIRAWWEENREKTQRFFNNEMQHPGTAPYYCEPWIDKAIIIQHLYSPAMWSIFQLQDLMGIDIKIRRENPKEERINDPSVARYYWRYRMHIPLEQLLKEDDLNSELSSYIQSSGRNEK